MIIEVAEGLVIILMALVGAILIVSATIVFWKLITGQVNKKGEQDERRIPKIHQK